MKGRPSSLLLLAVACALGCAQAFPPFSSFFGSKSKDSKTVPGAQVWPKGLNKGFSKGMAGKQSPLRTPLFSAAYTIKSPPHHLHKAAAPPPAGAPPPTLEAHYEVRACPRASHSLACALACTSACTPYFLPRAAPCQWQPP